MSARSATGICICGRPSTARATGGEHSAIADAIAKGDGEAAAKAVRTHIESLRTRLMRAQDVKRGRGPMPKPLPGRQRGNDHEHSLFRNSTRWHAEPR